MNRTNKQNLFITIIFALIVSMTLFYMYDNFVFQTYSEVVYYDYLLSGENNDIKVENIEAYHNEENFSLGDGIIVFKNSNMFETNVTPIIKLVLKSNEQKFEYEVELVDYSKDKLNYEIDKIIKDNKKINLDNIETAELIVSVNDNIINKLNLKITPIEQLDGSNKEYRIENASISKKMIRLGNLKTTNKDIIEEYPVVSLEYRYLKDSKKEKEDNDNYVVFKKITGLSKDLINSNDYGTYYLDFDDFKNKDLSVVIIFSNDDDKFVFSIDLVTRQVGDYYG
ncbi:hypothetical protein [Thomasclavelia cocleata]|uniref:hypothetical protein n=1 Tax=Thomasclavelia cocleata TaxID=69824 RepID=UPI0025763969|nr:hypothetical protein [Thomasclavelia cocleata]